MGESFGSPWFGFVLGVLAVWRVTRLLHAEHGPFGVFDKTRRLAARVRAGGLFDCFYCLSLWIAVPAALYLTSGWPERVLLWLALSAGAIVLEVKFFLGPTDKEGT
jgi:hypothetical protein